MKALSLFTALLFIAGVASAEHHEEMPTTDEAAVTAEDTAMTEAPAAAHQGEKKMDKKKMNKKNKASKKKSQETH